MHVYKGNKIMAKTKKAEEKGDLFSMEKLLNEINSQYGQGALMTENTRLDIDKCSYGSLGLDIASGGGSGIGKWVEVFGEESTGKTTGMINSMVAHQKLFPNKAVAVIDYEHAFDVNYARKLGLNTSSERFVMAQPDNGEQGFDIAEKLILSGKFSIIGIDSVAAATPKSEIEGETGDQTMGVHARLMGRVCRKLKGISNKHDVSMYWINQMREKIGVMFGSPEVVTGGKALKFFMEQRIRLYKSDKTEFANKGVTRVRAKFIKNKLSAPFGETEYYLKYGEGIDRMQELIDTSLELAVIKRAGSWYSYGETKLGQGEATVRTLLEDNKELCEEIEKTIRQQLNIK